MSIPNFKTYDDGRFRCMTLTLDDGRYVVVTDTGGMDYPALHDFNVCVYRSENAFGDDPTDSILACATSDQFDDMTAALEAVGVQP